jgi:hypothetical protein
MSLKAKIYSRLDHIKKATKNYTLEGTPNDLTGVLQQVEVVRRHPCACNHSLKR